MSTTTKKKPALTAEQKNRRKARALDNALVCFPIGADAAREAWEIRDFATKDHHVKKYAFTRLIHVLKKQGAIHFGDGGWYRPAAYTWVDASGTKRISAEIPCLLPTRGPRSAITLAADRVCQALDEFGKILKARFQPIPATDDFDVPAP